MKNTTKKILSMLLTVVMLLSVMPVAYASPAEYPPEVEQYIEFWIKVESYRNNKYESEANRDELFKILGDKLFNSGLDDIPLGDTGLILYEYIYDKNIDIEEISHFNEVMQPAINEIEAKIATGEIGVVINTYEFIKLEGFVAAYYNNELINETLDRIESTNNETFQNLIANSAGIYFYNAEDFANQSEYDIAVDTLARPYFTIITNCLDGNHPYGEYISNNDATEEADGTKTATCDFCGATDTVIDEGSKIDNNDNCKCSCNCHKSGIMGIIWKILNFFYKIFGMNKTCSCGVAHY